MSAVLNSDRHERGNAAAEVFVGMLKLFGLEVAVAKDRFSHWDMELPGGRRLEFKYRPSAFENGMWKYPDAIVDIDKLAANHLMVWMQTPASYAVLRTHEAEGLTLEKFHDPERDQISDIVRVPAHMLMSVDLEGLLYELLTQTWAMGD